VKTPVFSLHHYLYAKTTGLVAARKYWWHILIEPVLRNEKKEYYFLIMQPVNM